MIENYLSKSGVIYTKTTLFKNHKDSIGTWSIFQLDEHNFQVDFQRVIGGAVQSITEYVPCGLASRTLQEQLDSRINSRINHQLNKGYVHTIAQAKSAPTNALGFPQPMLAKVYEKVSKAIREKDGFYQPKLDGHRCLVIFDEDAGEWIAYSRVGKLIPAIKHILQEIASKNPPTDYIFDGELYCHGMPLQQIASLVKREQPDTLKIKYFMYDVMTSLPYKERHDILEKHFINNVGIESSIRVVGITHKSQTTSMEYLAQCLKDGYEGAMFRTNGTSDFYEAGRRSSTLLKIKSFQDAEYEVVGIDESKDGWAILTCKLENRTFRVSAPGTIEEKTQVLNNASTYIGTLVTVRYSMLTNDGVPFHPVALRFREDL